MHLHLAPFTFSSSYIFYHPICVMYIDHSWYYCVYQCLGLVLWSTEVLTEGLPLLFGIPFSIVIFLALLFAWCGHFLLINTWMDGWNVLSLSVCLPVCSISVTGSEVVVCFQRRWLNALVLSICLSVRPSCLRDNQRGICLLFSEGGLMQWHCPSVSLSVCSVCAIGSEVFVCYSAKAA